MTLDRWYRHAAIFLWPEKRHFEVICDRDSRAVVPELVRMIGRRKRAGSKSDAAVLEQCRELAAAIVAKWPEQKFTPDGFQDRGFPGERPAGMPPRTGSAGVDR